MLRVGDTVEDMTVDENGEDVPTGIVWDVVDVTTRAGGGHIVTLQREDKGETITTTMRTST